MYQTLSPKSDKLYGKAEFHIETAKKSPNNLDLIITLSVHDEMTVIRKVSILDRNDNVYNLLAIQEELASMEKAVIDILLL